MIVTSRTDDAVAVPSANIYIFKATPTARLQARGGGGGSKKNR